VANRLVDVETGKVWELRAREENRHTSAAGDVTYRYCVNCRASADVRLGWPWISKHHGQLQLDKDGWWVVDGGSVNTVTVNGERVVDCGRRTIANGDVLGFGKTRLRFEADGEEPDS